MADAAGFYDEDVDEKPRKIFVGGLSWSTTPENLRDYFQQFGDVIECMIMKDVFTKRSRGFGFITFNDAESVTRVLDYGEHELDGKTIDPKVAFPRERQTKKFEQESLAQSMSLSPYQMVTRTKKVFVGGLSSSTTQEHLRTYFARFGKIEDVTLMYDRATQRHRGFGFVTFADENTCDVVVDLHFHDINDRKVECKKAQPKEVMWAQNYANSKNALFLRNGAAGIPQLADILAAALPLAAGAAAGQPSHPAYTPLALIQTRPVAFTPYSLLPPATITPTGAYIPNEHRPSAYDILNAGMAAAYAPGIGFQPAPPATINLFTAYDDFAAAAAFAATPLRYNMSSVESFPPMPTTNNSESPASSSSSSSCNQSAKSVVTSNEPITFYPSSSSSSSSSVNQTTTTSTRTDGITH